MGETWSWDRPHVLRDDARIGTLSFDVWHHSFLSLSRTVEKFNSYTDALLESSLATGKKYSPWRIPFAMTGNFLRYYILHRQFLYGFWGYINSVNAAWLRFLKYAKYYEETQRTFEEPPSNDSRGTPNV